MSKGSEADRTDALSLALACPMAAAEAPANLADSLHAHGCQLAAEADPARLDEWARRTRPGVLLLCGAALRPEAWDSLPASLGMLRAAGWHVIGIVGDTDPGGSLGARLLGVGADDVCVAAPPWTLLLRRLAAHFSARRAAAEHERLRRAVEVAPCGLTITDALAPDNPIIFANDGFRRITGYAPHEILGRNCRFLQRGRSDQPGVAELRDAVAAGRECHVRLVNFRKDGRAFHNELALTPLHDPDGRLSAFVGIQMDVTARVEADLAVRESEERFRTLADLLPTRVWLTDEEGRFTFLNEAWRDFRAGDGAEPPDPRGWLRWVHPEDRAAVDEHLARAQARQRPLGFEARLTRPTGEERWFKIAGVPRIGSEGAWRGFLGSALDVTEDRASHDLLGRRLRQLSLQAMILRQLVGDDGATKALEMIAEVAGASSLHLLALGEGGRLHEPARWGAPKDPSAASPFAGRRLSEILPFSAGPLAEEAEPVIARANERRRLAAASALGALVLAPIAQESTLTGVLAAASLREDGEWESACVEVFRGIGPALPSLLAAVRAS